jgi:hypothetical protein
VCCVSLAPSTLLCVQQHHNLLLLPSCMQGKFTWITEHGISERWVVANCGNFSVGLSALLPWVSA